MLYACRTLVYVNAAANPIIYNAMSAKFRHAFLRLFGMKPRAPSRILRRRSTLTTTFSSSSNASGSSRSNSFRRIANFTLKRSFSDATIKGPYKDGPRLSSPSVLAYPKKSPALTRTKGGLLGKWYLKRTTSGSYFSGDSFCSISSEDALNMAPILNTKTPQDSGSYSPLIGRLRNGHLYEKNRSLPELFKSSPASVKRVSFKDNILPFERPKPVISPLTVNPLIDGLSEPEPNQLKKKFTLKKIRKKKTRRVFCGHIFSPSKRNKEVGLSRKKTADSLKEQDLNFVELKEMI